jgi:hypothetical protein
MWGFVFFIALNLVDAWLTKQALALGSDEANPLVRYFNFGDDLLLKGLLALVIALFVLCLRKSHLFRYLNIAMLVIVVWNMAVVTVSIIYC